MGLLDSLGTDFSDPQSQAVYALAGGLLSPGSLGQGMSRGIAGYQGTLANAQDMAAKKQALEMQKLQFAAALRNQNLINDALAGGLAQMSPGQAAPQASPQGPSQPSVMAGAGSQPPFMSSNITMGGTAPQPAAPPAAPPTFLGAPIGPAMGDLVFNNGRGISGLAMKYMTPVRVQGGGGLAYPDGRLVMTPPSTPGAVQNRNADGTWVSTPVQGGTAAMAAASVAQATGKAGFGQTDVIGPAGATYKVFNKNLPGFDGSPSSLSPPLALNGAGQAVVPRATQVANDATALQIAQQELQTAPPGPQRDQLVAAIGRMQAGGSPIPSNVGSTPMNLSPSLPAGAVQTGLPPGVATGADNAQNTMTGSYKSLMGANNSAQTVQARLDQIAQFSKQAILGGDTQWRDYANNLMSIVQQAGGTWQGDAATDRKTAGDLLDKNASQIALAIGAGSQGTDALRSLAAAANPNRHMTQPAINEAVAQLQASAQVQQAKAQVLTPLYNAGNPQAYNTAEQQFDKNADFRVWQISKATQGMTQPQALAYFQAHGYTPKQISQLNTQRTFLNNQFGLGL
jgi:hypothetical protein